MLHLHPLAANALTCNADAEALAEKLLGDDAVVVDYIDPGVPLARGIAAERAAYTARTGKPAPRITLLRNHGIIVSGDTAAEVAAHVATVTDAIRTAIDAVPTQPAPAADEAAVRQIIDEVAPTLRGLLGGDRLAVVAQRRRRARARRDRPRLRDGRRRAADPRPDRVRRLAAVRGHGRRHRIGRRDARWPRWPHTRPRTGRRRSSSSYRTPSSSPPARTRPPPTTRWPSSSTRSA